MTQKTQMSSFENYLMTIGLRSNEFGITTETLYSNLEYFKDSWERHVGPYIALVLLTPTEHHDK